MAFDPYGPRKLYFSPAGSTAGIPESAYIEEDFARISYFAL
jgi:hypothetical protein